MVTDFLRNITKGGERHGGPKNYRDINHNPPDPSRDINKSPSPFTTLMMILSTRIRKMMTGTTHLLSTEKMKSIMVPPRINRRCPNTLHHLLHRGRGHQKLHR